MKLRALALLLIASAPLLGPAGDPGNAPAGPASRRLLLRLRTPAEVAREPGAAPVALVSQRRISGPPQRERRPEPSTQQLLLVVLGSGNEEIARVTVIDPRLVRAELPGPTGELTSTLLVRDDVQFPVVIPDHPAAHRVEIFKPDWTGAKFVLLPVGAVELP